MHAAWPAKPLHVQNWDKQPSDETGAKGCRPGGLSGVRRQVCHRDILISAQRNERCSRQYLARGGVLGLRAADWGGDLAKEAQVCAEVLQTASQVCLNLAAKMEMAEASLGKEMSAEAAQAGVSVIKGGDNTPVTAADFAIQAIIAEKLKAAFPDDRFMGEEVCECTCVRACVRPCVCARACVGVCVWECLRVCVTFFVIHHNLLPFFPTNVPPYNTPSGILVPPPTRRDAGRRRPALGRAQKILPLKIFCLVTYPSLVTYPQDAADLRSDAPYHSKFSA